MRPIVLTIAGSDPSGGAGIQADLKAIEASGGYAATAITALTVQDTRGVLRVDAVDAELVGEQIRTVLADMPVAAVKTGMLATAAIVARVARLLRAHERRPYVLDPVVAASDGTPLLTPAALEVLMRELLPQAALVTPNLEEVAALTGHRVRSLADAERAGGAILELGAAAVLITGGHLDGPTATDLLVTASGSRRFSSERIDSPHTHGSGCVCASAIATQLALGRPLEEAVERAKRLVVSSIRNGLHLGRGRGPVDPLHRLHATASMAASTERR